MDDLVLPKKVLLVDDDTAIAEALDQPLRKYGITLVRAGDLTTAMYNFNQQMFEVVIVELEFSPLPGLALVQKFRAHANKERREAGVIIASGQQRKNTDENLADELGDMEFVQKPLSAIKLLPALGRALQRKRALAQLEDVRTICYDMLQKAPGDFEAVIDFLKPKLAKLPKRGTQLMLSLYEESGRFEEALQLCEQLLAKDPGDLVTLNTQGRLYLRLGQADQAKAVLEKADKMAPMNIDRAKAMADMYLQLNDPNASINKMREVLALSPEQKDMKFDLFRQLEHFGFADHAVSFCKETTPPAEVVRFYNNKGVALSKTGSPSEALGEYQTALKYYPAFRENYRIHFNIALAEASQRTPEGVVKATAALERCLELNPDFEKAKALLGMLQKATGKKAS